MGNNYNISIKIINLKDVYLFPRYKTEHIVQHQLLLIDLKLFWILSTVLFYFIHKFPENGSFSTIRQNRT